MSNVRRARASDGALLLAMAAAFATLTCVLAFARYHGVHHRTFDLALYARMAWGLSHGNAWDPIVSGSFLGGHVAWVLVPLGWLGRLFGTVEVLLVAQSAAAALAALPLARMAGRRMGPRAALVVAACFLLYPNLGHVTTYEFHPGNLALWPLAAALDALDEGRPGALMWCCLLVLACRVSLALQTVVIGLVALRDPRLRRSGSTIAVLSAGYFMLWQLVLRPAFAGEGADSLDLHFGQWGGSPLGVLPALLSDPARVLEHVSTPARALYPLLVLSPLALLPVMRPAWLLIAAPPLLLNMISQFPTTTELYSHYLTPAVPPLLAAAVLALSARDARSCRSGLIALCFAAALGSYYFGGMPWSRDFPAADFRSDARTYAAERVLAQIAPERSVQAPDPLLPHLAERLQVHRAPPPERGTELTVLDLSHRRRYAAREDLLRTREEPLARAWLARDDHGVRIAEGDLVLLERGADPRAGPPARYLRPPSAGPGQPVTGCLEVVEARLEGRQLSVVVRAHGPCPSDLALRLGPSPRPTRVDLPFDGLLSPAHLRAGDTLVSPHPVTGAEARAMLREGLWVGALRSSGARPQPRDPVAVRVRVIPPAGR